MLQQLSVIAEAVAELWAAFYGAREVLALGALAAILAVEAEAGAAARRAKGALLVVLAAAGAAAIPAPVAPLSMLAEAGAAAILALDAPRAVLADAGATACLAPVGLLAMWALLSNAPLDWMRRWGVRRCWSCWGCQIHGGEL